ncbi:MAG: ABC transporter substrate-binding protein [Deltaproteobacteria bacterium]
MCSTLVLVLALIVTSVCADEHINFVMWKPNQPELWREVIATFERESGVRIVREIGPHSSTSAHALLAQKLKNRDPNLDVFLMDVIWPPEFASAGWAMPLDELFPVEDRQDFFSGAITACTFRNKIYGVPFWISGGLLYYRKDLLKTYRMKPPKTWDELVRQAKKIVRGERERNRVLWGYSGQFKQYEGLVCNMQEFLLSNRGKLLDLEDRRSTLDNTSNIEAIRYVRDRIIGSVAPRGVLTYEEPESLHLFIQGHAVFHRNWPYAWEIANSPKKSRIAGRVAITLLPHFPKGRSVSTLGGWQFGISAFSRKKRRAWEFIKFMTSPRIQKLFALRASQAPARRSLYMDPEVLSRNPHFATLKAVFDITVPRPLLPLYPLYSDILQRFYSRAISFKDSAVKLLARQADKKVQDLLSLSEAAGR